MAFDLVAIFRSTPPSHTSPFKTSLCKEPVVIKVSQYPAATSLKRPQTSQFARQMFL